MNDAATIELTWRSALMFAVCVPVVMSGVVLLCQHSERPSARFLGLFLLAAVIKVVPQIIGFAGFYDVWPGLTFAPFNVELFFGPLLLLHAHHLMNQQPAKKLYWLLLPGCIQLLYYCWAFLWLGDYQNKWRYNESFHHPYVIPVESVLAVILFVYCLFQAYHLSRRYERYLENNQSAAADFKPVWIQRLLLAILLLLMLFIIIQMVPLFITELSYTEEYPLVVTMMCILAWVGFEAIRKINHPFPKMMAATETVNQPSTTEKDWQLEAKLLAEQMSEQQWFLEPKLSLRELAQKLGSNESYISRTINQGLGQSFNHYINSLRVAYAQQQLKSANASVLTLAFESGFNSKATFNRVFKAQVGMTPSQYKKNQ